MRPKRVPKIGIIGTPALDGLENVTMFIFSSPEASYTVIYNIPALCQRGAQRALESGIAVNPHTPAPLRRSRPVFYSTLASPKSG